MRQQPAAAPLALLVPLPQELPAPAPQNSSTQAPTPGSQGASQRKALPSFNMAAVLMPLHGSQGHTALTRLPGGCFPTHSTAAASLTRRRGSPPTRGSSAQTLLSSTTGKERETSPTSPFNALIFILILYCNGSHP